MNIFARGAQARFFLSACLLSNVLAGCASGPTPADDPWVNWNKGAHDFNQGVDEAILKPMAKGYLWMTSDGVDEGVTNFFSNINDIGVTVNDLLQFKFVQSGMDASRFLINTTAGVMGIFDVAKQLDLPKHNEDFGQTLGYWGIPAGPYLVLPFFGASSPRDAVGLIGDALLDPLSYTFLLSGGLVNAVSIASSAVDVTDTRAGLMMTEKLVNEASVNKYDFMKNAYQQRREYLVHDGQTQDADDPMLELEGMDDLDKTSKPAKPPQAAGKPGAPAGTAPVTNRPRHTLDLTAP